MNARKGVGRASPVLAAAVALGLFIAAFNFAVLFVRNTQKREGSGVGDDIIRLAAYKKSVSAAGAGAGAGAGRRFHVAMTASGDPYSRWQSRIMYYWYKLAKAAGSGTEEMGRFTRVLHSGEADYLMEEIPTFVVDPLPPGIDRGYVVLNRPWAFVQWLERAEIEEEYILMAEPDHIFAKPLPNLVREDHPVAYPFFYIRPAKYEKILRKYYPEEKGPITNIDPIGNSPVIIDKSLLRKIAPTWMNMSLEMKMDNETDKAFGWVLEMYAYAVASALHGVHHVLYKDFMIQPPWDLSVGNTFIIHYTYGCDYSLKGELTYGKIGEWHFDKRSYLQGPPPRNLPLPPPGVPESVVTLVKMLNEATANIPGWDDDNSQLPEKFKKLNNLHSINLIQEKERSYI